MRRLSLIVLLVVLPLTACQNLPVSTRTGVVLDVRITDRLATSTFSANVGDEIRWINTSTRPARIVFMDRISDQIICRRNFSGHFTGGVEASLAPNESASLCFGNTGTIRYTIAMQSVASTDYFIQPGLLQVEMPLDRSPLKYETPIPQGTP